MQHAHPCITSPPPPQNLPSPAEQLIAPSTANQDPTNHIHDPDEQCHEPSPLFPDGQQDWLDIELEEDAGHAAFVDRVRLRRHRVLIREDCRGRAFARHRGACVDCRDHGAVVLVLEKVFGRRSVCFVERVQEGRVEWAKGEFVDDVGEIEGCPRPPVSRIRNERMGAGKRRRDGERREAAVPVWSKCCPNSIYPCPLAVM